MASLSSRSSSLPSRSPSLSSISSKKHRRAITDAEKKLIRDFYYKDSNNKPSLMAAQAWFEEIHYHKIAPSSLRNRLFSI